MIKPEWIRKEIQKKKKKLHGNQKIYKNTVYFSDALSVNIIRQYGINKSVDE